MIEVSGLSKVFNRLFPGHIDHLNRKLFRLAAQGATRPHLADDLLSLLKRGADINKPAADGSTVLNMICGQGLPEVVDMLVNIAGADVNHANASGTTPVMMAAWTANAQTMQILLDHGANAKAKNNNGRDAVNELLEGGRENARKNPVQQGECLKLLSAHGAVGAADKFAVYQKRPDLAFAIPEVADAKAMQAAGESRDLKALKELLDRGVSPDLPCRFANNPPLFYAAKEGDMDMIALLRKAGANPREGHPVLLVAAEHGQREAFEALLDMGADFKATYPDSKTVFDYARECGDSGMETFINDLLAKRATPETVLTKEITTMPRLRLKNSSTPV